MCVCVCVLSFSSLVCKIRIFSFILTFINCPPQRSHCSLFIWSTLMDNGSGWERPVPNTHTISLMVQTHTHTHRERAVNAISIAGIHMYGLACSRMHTVGRLYSTILFASFLTMTAVMDIIRDDCFKDWQWKEMNITVTCTHAHTHTKGANLNHGRLSCKPRFTSQLRELLFLFCLCPYRRPRLHKRINISKARRCE